MRAALAIAASMILTGCYNVLVLNVAGHPAVMTGKLPPSEVCAAALVAGEHMKLTSQQLEVCSSMAKTPETEAKR